MFHLHVRYQSRDGGGSSEAARQYLAREGRYAKRGDKVRWVLSLHMPEWATGASAPLYWQAAEGRHSRVNARTAMLVEFAIPKQLSVEGQDALVRRMLEAMSATGCEKPSSERLPLTAAIHEGYGRNPHVHALLSLSLNDEIRRCEETWFKRYSPKHPPDGGARRSQYVAKRRWLYRLRELWATLANAALVGRDMQPVMDHRSYTARGVLIAPQIHLGPRVSEMARNGVDTARGRRSRAIQAANDVALEMEALLLHSRQALLRAEREEDERLQTEQLWREKQEEEWTELLSSHPLGRSSGELRAHASALVIESDRANLEVVGRALDMYPNARPLAGLLGSDWDAVATPAGLWGIRPGRDGVVLVGRGYVATDGHDEASLRALLSAAPMLRMKEPLVAVEEALRRETQALLDALGCGWRVVTLNRSEKNLKGAPAR